MLTKSRYIAIISILIVIGALLALNNVFHFTAAMVEQSTP